MKASNLILLGLLAFAAASVAFGVVTSKVGVAGPVELTGERITRDLDANPLRHLDLEGPMRVILTAGIPKLSIEGDRAVVAALEDTDPDPARLKLDLPDGLRLPAGEEIVARIQTPTLETIDLSGSVRVETPAALPFARNAWDVSGNTRLELSYADAASLEFDGSGSTNVRLAGRARFVDAEFSGSAGLEAGELQARVVSIDASGSSTSTVRVDSVLRFAGSGSNVVEYYGSPRVESSNSGSGGVRALGD